MAKSRKPPGQQLEARLSELGLSRSDLIARLNVPSGTLSRWISGDRIPSLEMAVRIEREIGFPVETWIRKAS